MELELAVERWPIAGGFTISRGSKDEAEVVVATLREGDLRGRGECVPYARYGESVASVSEEIEAVASRFGDALSRVSLSQHMAAPGAARNALDCALWDLEAKRQGVPVHVLAALPPLHPVLTAFTISLGSPAEMASAARRAEERPLLKLKLGGDGDAERLAAVREAVPSARLIADANEAWPIEQLEMLMLAAEANGIELIEQPLPAEEDAILAEMPRPVPICADESAHDRTGLEELARRYDAINIKLDKTGGLTEALAMAGKARELDLEIMVGCMVATSLAMAPALLLAQEAEWVDLDGPLLLAEDREAGLAYDGALLYPPDPELWG
ncbi:N-acetyl-D-Glu racemase DgcA [Methyloligella sp. 2.7D]|uniref:N-acetyl-D-Glu racemase DgcA n=1 Tax=unclassified Methyloligella TaxID=2625955 RepID=UPI00157D26CE|nr:N-acetyl-D-Glu racemase DgcA [Methyloligella sp. GL2]QKP77880.1 dipeptide epimerase [Methyloligella sp. GL2]